MENPYLSSMNHATHIVYYAVNEPYYWDQITKLLGLEYTTKVRPHFLRTIETRMRSLIETGNFLILLSQNDTLTHKVVYALLKSAIAQVDYALISEAILWHWERRHFLGMPKIEDISFSQLNPEE
jgi:hypothetical protein